MNAKVPVPVMRSFAGLDLPTPSGKSLPHSLALDHCQVVASGPRSSLSSEGCFPDAAGGVMRAAMWCS